MKWTASCLIWLAMLGPASATEPLTDGASAGDRIGGAATEAPSDKPKDQDKDKDSPKDKDGAREKNKDQTAEKGDAKDKEADEEEEDPIKRLAELRLDEHLVPARVINLPLPGKTKTVQDILDRFEDWSEDEKIGAVLLDLGNLAVSLPDVEELRGGIARVRESGRKVTAFLNGGGPTSYLLACAADEIVLAPTGSVIIPGLGAVFPFLKGHYQMLGLEFDVITAGRFKYPGFVNEREPNQYFKEEYNAILDSWITDYEAIIAKNRKLAPEAVKDIVNVALFNANQALQRGLVDNLAYYDECRDRLLRRDKLRKYKDGSRDLSNVNSIQDLVEMVNDELRRHQEARKAVGPKIAVLHARGPIIDINPGAMFASQVIARDDFVAVVDELRRNKSIKAVVMRVDSPGGSGYASDVIWQQLRRLNEEKPLVVSMGRVAGSGGYYIACPARRIFAQPTTITGSIGVLGVFQSAQSRLNRMDYELAEMKRGDRATLGSPHRAISKEDRQFIQGYIDDFYGVFVDRVATTRRLPADQVRKLAEGRIYTGRQALEIGLVDELGGLAEAIESARGMADIPPSAELKIVHYPRPGSLGEIFESLGSASAAGVNQTVELFLQGVASARPVSFDEQLLHFSAGAPRPLCWMATPLLDAFDGKLNVAAPLDPLGGGLEQLAVPRLPVP
ncbi:MAG: signal peptide peptidase SppA [Planctomycetes bacterium]|nr:signal peptide peptidase SppA [Planctomycetota bacterium]